MAVLTLGVWGFGRDSSAVLVDENSIVAAIEEEKLSRSTGSGGLPRLAISRCLDQRGARTKDIQAMAFPRRLAVSALREAKFLLAQTLSGSGSGSWLHSFGHAFRDAVDTGQWRWMVGVTGQLPNGRQTGS